MDVANVPTKSANTMMMWRIFLPRLELIIKLYVLIVYFKLVNCVGFLKCCIVSMKICRSFKSLSEAHRFATDCFHFKYEHAHIELCQEGNVYENARHYAMRYFSSIDTPESFTSQRLKQLTLSDKMVDKIIPYGSMSLLNPICRPSGNGAKVCSLRDARPQEPRGILRTP